MNPKKKENSYIFFLVIFSLLISLIAIYFSLEKSVVPDFEHLLNIIAIIITSTAFLIGCYFATLAVTAYSHIKELEKSIADVKKIKGQMMDLSEVEQCLEKSMERISEFEENADLMFSDSADAIDLILGYEIDILNNRKLEKSSDLVAKENHKQKYDVIYSLRVRLCYAKKLKLDRRLSLFVELAEYGDDSDIPRLEKVFNDKKEPKEITDLAKGIYRILVQKEKEKEKEKEKDTLNDL